MNRLLQDLSYGARILGKSPGFAIAAVLTLALGIGANTAVFTVVHSVLLRPLPYPEPQQLAVVWEASPSTPKRHLSYPTFADLREQARSFAAFSAHSGRWGGPDTVLASGRGERAVVTRVFRDFFSVFAVQPQLGRTFVPGEHEPGGAPAAVISYDFWQSALAGGSLDDAVIAYDDSTFQVVGVMPPGFQYPAGTQIWVAADRVAITSTRSAHNFVGIGRLREGVTTSQARSELETVAGRLRAQHAEWDEGHSFNLVSLHEQLVGGTRHALNLLFAAVVLLLLIACGNVANLLLARSWTRRREMAMRSALGAPRGRLVRQLLTETMLLGLAGAAAGLLLGWWMLHLLTLLAPRALPRTVELSFDPAVLGFTLLVSAVAVLLFGLAPALQVSSVDPNKHLKEGGRGTEAGGARLRSALVLAEVALTFVLLVGGGLLARSLYSVLNVDLGFNPESVLHVDIALPDVNYPTPEARRAFFQEAESQVAALPGVASVGMVNNLPLGGVNISGAFHVEGPAREELPYAGFRVASPGYFATLQIPLLRGRLFTEQDSGPGLPVAILSQSAARAAFGEEDPLGRRIRSQMDARGDVWMTVIGVVGDVRHSGGERDLHEDLYVPLAQRPQRTWQMAMVVRQHGRADELGAAVLQRVRALDATLPLAVQPMDALVARQVADRRYTLILLAAFAAVALLLSTLGLYGVLSYAVAARTHELGTRLALGAQPAHLLRMVLGEGLRITVFGLLLGVAGGLILGRVAEHMLFGVGAADPLTYLALAVLVLAVGALSSYIPARRATQVDPMVALRAE